jgi:hypothetical protein
MSEMEGRGMGERKVEEEGRRGERKWKEEIRILLNEGMEERIERGKLEAGEKRAEMGNNIGRRVEADDRFGTSLLSVDTVSYESCHEAMNKAKEALLTLSSLTYSAYAPHFLSIVDRLSAKISPLPDVITMVVTTQHLWLTLRQLFRSPPMASNVDRECPLFFTISDDWGNMRWKIREDPRVSVSLAAESFIPQVLSAILSQLTDCQRLVIPFFRRKQDEFPGLFLLPEDKLIEFLSSTTPESLTGLIQLILQNVYSFGLGGREKEKKKIGGVEGRD